jgi:hypothetical protein
LTREWEDAHGGDRFRRLASDSAHGYFTHDCLGTHGDLGNRFRIEQAVVVICNAVTELEGATDVAPALRANGGD